MKGVLPTPSMSHTARLKRNPAIFRRLTGITPEKFDDIIAKLRPRYDAWNERRLSRDDRKHRIGGGRLFTLVFEDRVLMLLLYYRHYITHAFLGFLFRIDNSNVGRNIRPLQPLLASIFVIPEREVTLSREEIWTLFFDGTEQQVERPGNKEEQKAFYSGKKKRHTIKHLVVVVKKRKRGRGKRKLRIALVSKAFAGRTHDKRMYEETRTLSPPGARRKGDLGFLGTILEVPIKKPKGKKLTPRQKAHNRRFSSERVCVEHGIGKMKQWQVLAQRFRNPLGDHTVIFKNVAGLHNLMFA